MVGNEGRDLWLTMPPRSHAGETCSALIPRHGTAVWAPQAHHPPPRSQFILRNYLLHEAIQEAEHGELRPLQELMAVVKRPFEEQVRAAACVTCAIGPHRSPAPPAPPRPGPARPPSHPPGSTRASSRPLRPSGLRDLA